MTSAHQPKGDYSALFSSVCRCHYGQGFSGRAAEINRAQKANCIACTRALHTLCAHSNFQALFINQGFVAKNACVEQVNQDGFDAGISAPYKDINFFLEDNKAKEEEGNKEEKNPAAIAVAMVAKLPSAALAPSSASPAAPIQCVMRNNIS